MPIWTVAMLLGALGLFLSLAQWLIPPFKKFQQSLGDWTPLFSVGVLLLLSIGALLVNCQFAWACIVLNWLSYWTVFTSGVVTYYGSYHAFIKPAKTIQTLRAAQQLTVTQAVSNTTSSGVAYVQTQGGAVAPNQQAGK
jgi:hypothetical protein